MVRYPVWKSRASVAISSTSKVNNSSSPPIHVIQFEGTDAASEQGFDEEGGRAGLEPYAPKRRLSKSRRTSKGLYTFSSPSQL